MNNWTRVGQQRSRDLQDPQKNYLLKFNPENQFIIEQANQIKGYKIKKRSNVARVKLKNEAASYLLTQQLGNYDEIYNYKHRDEVKKWDNKSINLFPSGSEVVSFGDRSEFRDTCLSRTSFRRGRSHLQPSNGISH